MPQSTRALPPGVLLSAFATLGLALFTLVMAILSLAEGHGAFSGGVALALMLWGVLVGAGSVLLLRGARWARGPVIAAGLLHAFAFGQFALNNAPLAWLGAAAGVAAVVGLVLPASTGWFTRGS
ncbi:hypothetical protein [Propioniciclava sinopodophylli]|uniref:hypothetical protein n=1 Tax=Propioniciclava sinopodophylli TaxID=1837344 RepID=UPI00248F55FD|nr:hypothetical protein [Propioniciclava sinopodophylli]